MKPIVASTPEGNYGLRSDVPLAWGLGDSGVQEEHVDPKRQDEQDERAVLPRVDARAAREQVPTSATCRLLSVLCKNCVK